MLRICCIQQFVTPVILIEQGSVRHENNYAIYALSVLLDDIDLFVLVMLVLDMDIQDHVEPGSDKLWSTSAQVGLGFGLVWSQW